LGNVEKTLGKRWETRGKNDQFLCWKVFGRIREPLDILVFLGMFHDFWGGSESQNCGNCPNHEMLGADSSHWTFFKKMEIEAIKMTHVSASAKKHLRMEGDWDHKIRQVSTQQKASRTPSIV
jgi:hypothetical protein